VGLVSLLEKFASFVTISRDPFDEVESVSEHLDNRRLYPGTSFFMPTKRSQAARQKPRALVLL
jgi:hypothetical protein